MKSELKHNNKHKREAKMGIEFTTSEYRFEHGKDPKGYGFWGFEFEGHEFWHSGTLTEAKKECRKEVKRLAPEGYEGYVFVNILP